MPPFAHGLEAQTPGESVGVAVTGTVGTAVLALIMSVGAGVLKGFFFGRLVMRVPLRRGLGRGCLVDTLVPLRCVCGRRDGCLVLTAKPSTGRHVQPSSVRRSMQLTPVARTLHISILHAWVGGKMLT